MSTLNLDRWIQSGGGSSGRSTLPDWLRSGGSGGNRYAGIVAADSPFGPPTTDPALKSTRKRYENRMAEADVLGVDSDGTGDEGFLSWSLGLLDRPISSIIGAGSAALGLDDGDGDDTNDGVLDRFTAGLGGRHYGSGDFGVLRRDDDDGLVARVSKAVGSFAVDTLLDPLTYVTLGTGTIGRKAATKAAGKGVQRQAAGKLDDAGREVLERYARDGGTLPRAAEMARKETMDRAGDAAYDAKRLVDDGGLLLTDRSAADWLEAGADEIFAHLSEDSLRTLAREGVEGMAAEAYLKRGSRGLREFVEKEFGDRADEIWSTLPREVQGGIRVRVPFLKEKDAVSQFGVNLPRTFGFGGGGKYTRYVDDTLDGLGVGRPMDAVLQKSLDARSWLRTSKAGMWAGSRLQGRAGVHYGQALETLYDDPEDVARMGWSRYRHIEDLDEEVRVWLGKTKEHTQHTLAQVDATVKASGDEAGGYAAFDRFFKDPKLRKETDPSTLSAVEQAGFEAAERAAGLMDDLGRQALELFGGDTKAGMGWINDYVPRVMREEERERRRLLRAVRNKAKGSSAFDPVKRREQYVLSWDPQTGKPSEWMRLDDANELAERIHGEQIFKDRGVEILTDYAAAMTGAIRKKKWVDGAVDRGLVLRGNVDDVSHVNRFKVAALGRRIADDLSAENQQVKTDYERLLAEEATGPANVPLSSAGLPDDGLDLSDAPPMPPHPADTLDGPQAGQRRPSAVTTAEELAARRGRPGAPERLPEWTPAEQAAHEARTARLAELEAEVGEVDRTLLDGEVKALSFQPGVQRWYETNEPGVPIPDDVLADPAMREGSSAALDAARDRAAKVEELDRLRAEVADGEAARRAAVEARVRAPEFNELPVEQQEGLLRMLYHAREYEVDGQTFRARPLAEVEAEYEQVTRALNEPGVGVDDEFVYHVTGATQADEISASDWFEGGITSDPHRAAMLADIVERGDRPVVVRWRLADLPEALRRRLDRGATGGAENVRVWAGAVDDELHAEQLIQDGMPAPASFDAAMPPPADVLEFDDFVQRLDAPAAHAGPDPELVKRWERLIEEREAARLAQDIEDVYFTPRQPDDLTSQPIDPLSREAGLEAWNAGQMGPRRADDVEGPVPDGFVRLYRVRDELTDADDAWRGPWVDDLTAAERALADRAGFLYVQEMPAGVWAARQDGVDYFSEPYDLFDGPKAPAAPARPKTPTELWAEADGGPQMVDLAPPANVKTDIDREFTALEQHLEANWRLRAHLEAALDPAKLPAAPDELNEYLDDLVALWGEFSTRQIERLDRAEARMVARGVKQDTIDSLRRFRKMAKANRARAESTELSSREVFDRTMDKGASARFLEGEGLGAIGQDTGALRDAGLLDDLFAPESIREAAEKMFKARTDDEGVRKFFDQVYVPWFNFFKTWATVGRGPGFVFRNVIGGTQNAWLVGAQAGHFNLALALTHARASIAKQARKGNLDPDQIAELEGRVIRDHLRRKGGDELVKAWEAFDAARLVDNNRNLEHLVDAGFYSGQPLVAAGQSSAGLWPLARPDELNRAQRLANKTVNNRYIEGMSNVAARSEEYLRFASFLAGIDKFGLEDGGMLAALTVKASQFDYADLSDFERRVMKNVLPFYTWSRNNVPLQIRALMTEPGKIQRLINVNESLEQAFGATDGDDQELNEVLPEWVRERMGWVSRWSYGGSPLTIGMESPAIDLNKWLDAPFTSKNPLTGFGLIDPEEFVGNINPLAKVAVEAATKTDTFTGGKIEEYGEAPWWARLVPGLTHKEGDKTVAPSMVTRTLGQLLPPVGMATRYDPGVERYRDRLLTSAASQLVAFPGATFTDDQQKGELASRSDVLADEIRRQVPNADAVLEIIREMRSEGWPDVMIRNVLAGRGLID